MKIPKSLKGLLLYSFTGERLPKRDGLTFEAIIISQTRLKKIKGACIQSSLPVNLKIGTKLDLVAGDPLFIPKATLITKSKKYMPPELKERIISSGEIWWTFELEDGNLVFCKHCWITSLKKYKQEKD